MSRLQLSPKLTAYDLGKKSNFQRQHSGRIRTWIKFSWTASLFLSERCVLELQFSYTRKVNKAKNKYLVLPFFTKDLLLLLLLLGSFKIVQVNMNSLKVRVLSSNND